MRAMSRYCSTLARSRPLISSQKAGVPLESHLDCGSNGLGEGMHRSSGSTVASRELVVVIVRLDADLGIAEIVGHVTRLDGAGGARRVQLCEQDEEVALAQGYVEYRLSRVGPLGV